MTESRLIVRSCDVCANKASVDPKVIGHHNFGGWFRVTRYNRGSPAVELDVCCEACLKLFAQEVE